MLYIELNFSSLVTPDRTDYPALGETPVHAWNSNWEAAVYYWGPFCQRWANEDMHKINNYYKNLHLQQKWVSDWWPMPLRAMSVNGLFRILTTQFGEIPQLQQDRSITSHCKGHV